MQYRFTFPDQATWLAEADAAGWLQREYEPVDPSNPYAPPVVKREWVACQTATILEIGTIYEPAPTIPPKDYQPVPYPGYAVNILSWGEPQVPPNMVPYLIFPSSPRFTFLGDNGDGSPPPENGVLAA